jgi:S-disulfanyl-L-cysteine oxidoreductase SoxD
MIRKTRATALVVMVGVFWAATMTRVGLTAQDMRTVWDGVYTADQAKRGEALYTQHCGACHGGTLLGAEAAPALTGFEFASNWSGLTLGDLFERIRTSMPPDDPGRISAQQKADILAHMLRVGGFPAGTTDLSRDAQVLTQIKYVSTKP